MLITLNHVGMAELNTLSKSEKKYFEEYEGE